MDHNKLWKILKEMGIPDHLTCLLRNLYAGQEATVRTGHWTTDWFQIGKGVHQGCILSPCLFNFYAECIIRNAGLDEAQAEIKTAGRNINNLRYTNDTTLTAESKEELKSLLIKVKEESERKSWLKAQHSVHGMTLRDGMGREVGERVRIGMADSCECIAKTTTILYSNKKCSTFRKLRSWHLVPSFHGK